MDILVMHAPEAPERPHELTAVLEWLQLNPQLGSHRPEIWHNYINARRYLGSLKGAELVIEIYPEEITVELRQQHEQLEAELNAFMRTGGQTCKSFVIIVLAMGSYSDYDDSEVA